MEVLFLIIILVMYIGVRVMIALLYDEHQIALKKIKTGVQLLSERKHEEALLFFDNFLKKHPKNTLAYAYRGKCHLAMENYYAAIADCAKASSFSEDIPETYLDKGIALFKLALYKEALLELDKAVWHLKNNASAFRWRGMTKSMLDMYERAETDFRKATELGDEHANYYLLRKGKIEI
jgi:tetratricopeptide (TPR) repeat protein